jgi:aspartate-semialdehyde dehydrogenase
LSKAPGVIVNDDPAKNCYPLPAAVAGRNEVFVGRIREDLSIENGINLWIVADNLRKGAAYNAIQIAGYMVANKLI